MSHYSFALLTSSFMPFLRGKKSHTLRDLPEFGNFQQPGWVPYKCHRYAIHCYNHIFLEISISSTTTSSLKDGLHALCNFVALLSRTQQLAPCKCTTHFSVNSFIWFSQEAYLIDYIILNSINQLKLSYAAITYNLKISVCNATKIYFSLMSHTTGQLQACPASSSFQDSLTDGKKWQNTQWLLRHLYDSDTITPTPFCQSKQIS